MFVSIRRSDFASAGTDLLEYLVKPSSEGMFILDCCSSDSRVAHLGGYV